MKRGFTIIELLVVVAIIAIIGAIIYPVIKQAQGYKTNSQQTNSQPIDQITTTQTAWQNAVDKAAQDGYKQGYADGLKATPTVKY